MLPNGKKDFRLTPISGMINHLNNKTTPLLLAVAQYNF